MRPTLISTEHHPCRIYSYLYIDFSFFFFVIIAGMHLKLESYFDVAPRNRTFLQHHTSQHTALRVLLFAGCSIFEVGVVVHCKFSVLLR